MKALQKSKQIFIRLHVGRSNRDCGCYILCTVYDGLGQLFPVHRYGSK